VEGSWWWIVGCGTLEIVIELTPAPLLKREGKDHSSFKLL